MTSARAQVTPPQELTVREFLGQWLAHVRGRVRPRTFGGYESLLRINAIPSLGPIPLAEQVKNRLIHLRSLDVVRSYDKEYQEKFLAAGPLGGVHLLDGPEDDSD